jgi:hypothetical protein
LRDDGDVDEEEVEEEEALLPLSSSWLCIYIKLRAGSHYGQTLRGEAFGLMKM